MNFVEKLTPILKWPAGYRLLRGIVGGDALWRTYLDEYVKPMPGEKVLDIGCGPADVLRHLPPVDYTGLDRSEEYIHSAAARFGSACTETM